MHKINRTCKNPIRCFTADHHNQIGYSGIAAIWKARLKAAFIPLALLGGLLAQAIVPGVATAQIGTEADAISAADDVKTSTRKTGFSYESLQEDIDSFVEPFIGKSAPGAAIVITKNDQIIFSKGYGYADLEQRIPVDPARTVFGYGSINKLFVWTSVMQLVEQGKLDLEKDIRTYFPQHFQEKLRADKPFTLLDTMSHTAGYEEYSGALFVPQAPSLLPLDEALLSSQPEQLFEPGTVMSYSNFSTALAGYAVEHISGEAFSAYELRHILQPLGMDYTSGHPRLQDRPELLKLAAIGYGQASEGNFERRDPYDIPFYPAGAMKGTAEDLARFGIALTSPDHPLFTRAETGQILLSQSFSPDDDMPSNAHGFWEYSLNPRTVGHSGGTVGFSSNFAVVPEERLGIVVLTNMEGEKNIVPGLIYKLIQRAGEEPPIPAAKLKPSRDAAGKYVLSRNTLSTFQKVMGYLTRISVKPEGEFDFAVSVMGATGRYIQLKPDLYKLQSIENKSLKMAAPYLFINRDEHGRVFSLSGGQGMDMLKQTDFSGVVLPISAAMAGITLGFFIIAPLVLLVRWFIRKKRGGNPRAAARYWIGIVVGSGTAMSGVTLFMLAAMVGNPFAEVALFNRCIWLLYAFGLTGLICAAFAFHAGRKQPLGKGQLRFHTVTVLMWLGLIANLAGWNFFRFIA
jgi:CubicO group peptidase (beta-lactamase class C family)